MTSRDLPNVYVTLNDQSALIEGNDGLAVGITLRADRGPVGQALRVKDSDEFLSRFTFTGKPGAKQDSTYFDVIELLKASNNVYVSRSANAPLYGGLVIKKEKEIGAFKGVAEFNEKRIILDGDVTAKFPAGAYIRISDGKNSFRYVVKKAEATGDKTSVLLTEKVSSKLVDALKAAKDSEGAVAYARTLVGDYTKLDEFVEAHKDDEAYAETIEAIETLKEQAEENFYGETGLEKAEEKLAEEEADADKQAAYANAVAAEKLVEAEATEAEWAEYKAALAAYEAADEEGKEAAKAALDATTIGAAMAAIDATAIGAAKVAVEKAEAKVEADAQKAKELVGFSVSLPIYLCTLPKKLTDYVFADAEGKEDFIRTALYVSDEEKGYKGAFEVEGNMEGKFFAGDRLKFTVKGSNVKAVDADEYFYTVVSAVYIPESASTIVYVKEEIVGAWPAYVEGGDHAGVKVSLAAIADPQTFQAHFEEDDLFLIAGKDPGAYNGKIGIAIESGIETDLNEPVGAFKIYVHNDQTGADLEEFLVALNPATRAMNGVNIDIEGILEDEEIGSTYIQCVRNEAIDFTEEVIVPPSTPGRAANTFAELGGGYDGDELSVADDIKALEVFTDKQIAVSLLVNGGVENILYQLAMLSVCEARKDCFAILRTMRSHEKIALPAQRVRSMIDYKKSTLGSTDYLAAMYGPHVTTYDNFNLRNVTIGADSVACRKWLEVIRDYGYPRAAAGIDDGYLSGISLDWKIGDESSEAAEFNDASMNMIVWDARRKFYYLNTQNTLQLANSAFRNMGAVLNVLDIKEWMNFNLKYYIQKPIDGEGQLQEAILRTIEGYMDGCKSGGRVTDYFIQDVTTKTNISNNELHFVLTLCPAYYAQKIYLAINVVNATFDFQILQSM